MSEILERRSDREIPVGELARDPQTGELYRGDGVAAGGVKLSDGVTPGTVAAPVFSPDGAVYAGEQTVTITSATSGAKIRYLRNAGSPSETSGVLYRGPFTIRGTETIRAIAYKGGMVSSAVVAKTFTLGGIITPTALEVFEGQDATFSACHRGTPSSYQWQYSTDGATWQNVASAGTSQSYTIEDTEQAVHDGLHYRCLMDGVTSVAATLSVWSPNKLSPYVWINETSARIQERSGSGSTVAGDGDPVGELRDISGHARHFLAPSDAARPLNQTAYVNGRAGIQFQGADDVLKAQTAADWTFLHDGTTYLLAAVWKPGVAADPNALNILCATRSAGATPGMFVGHETRDSGGADRRITVSCSTGAATVVSNLSTDTTAPANIHQIVVVKNDPDNAVLPWRSRMWRNGDECVAHNTGTGTPVGTASANALNLGAGVDNTGTLQFPLTGDICEFVVISGDVTDENRLKLRDWLAYRWGISLDATAEVGIVSDGAQYRNKSTGLVASHNSPALHPRSPVYRPGPLNPGTAEVLYPNVIHDGTQFVMYAISYLDSVTPYTIRLVSDDGLNWTEPNLGVKNVGGNTDNCVIDWGAGTAPTAFLVLAQKISSKWVASVDLLGGSVAEVFVFESVDGITWAQVKDNSSVPGEYAEARGFIRKADGRLVQTYARGHAAPGSGDREMGFLLAPVGAYTGTWSDQNPVLLTSSNTDQKYAPAFEKHGRGWIMAMSAYNDDSAAGYPMDGDLYWFRSDYTFNKIKDAAFPLGPAGSWYDAMVMPTGIITAGNETRFYGSGSEQDHHLFPRNSKVGLWTMGKRRWSQLTGSGEFETPAFRANAAVLTLNANTVGGRVSVEVVDNATGAVMSGYDRAACGGIAESDTFDGALSWSGGALPTDREIRLRFVIENATLFSWTAGTE